MRDLAPRLSDDVPQAPGPAVTREALMREKQSATSQPAVPVHNRKPLAETSAVARAEAARAKTALAPLPPHPVKDMLTDLADYVVERIN